MAVRPGYKQTAVGVIPEDWEATTLGDVGEALIGLTYRPTDVRPDGILVLRSSNIQGGTLRFDDNVFVEMKVPARIMARVGDILICVRNGSRELIGKCALLDEQAEGMTFGAFMAVFRTPGSRFVYQQFQSAVIKQQIHEHLGATINQITNKSLNSFSIPLPPQEAEQGAIAAALSDADALIESLEQLLFKERQLHQAAMQELLRPRPTDEVRALGEVSSLKGRIGWQGLKQTEFTTNDDEPFLITGMNFKDGAIRWDEVYHISEARFAMAPEIQLRPRDVLMTKDGTIGKVLYIETIPHPGKASLNSHLLLFRPIGASYHPKYLYYQLGSQRFKDFVELSKSGTTFWGLSQAATAAYPVVLPPLEDQVRIAAILSDMDAQVGAVDANLTKARHIKQGMAQELLTGKIRLI